MTQPVIKLFELGPTRSARVRWALQEAELKFESAGNDISILGSQELRAVHPLGKLPAIIIDGHPLFESAAIVTAVADLVPDKHLIAPHGSWARNLHNQWMSFVQSEMEAFVQSSEVNRIDFILPAEARVPAIVEQNSMFYRKGAQVLETHLSSREYLVEDRFSVADIYAAYVLSWGMEDNLLEGFPHLVEHLARLRRRAACALPET